MNASAASISRATRLSETPLVHPTAVVRDSALGRYVEIGERCVVAETHVGDYSYLMQDCETWAARIGKFVNVASHVRINATNHPTWRATLHHFTYRANDYWSRRRARGRVLRLAARQRRRRSATTSGSAMARRSPPASRSATAR